MVLPHLQQTLFASNVKLISGGLKLTVSWSLEVVENWLKKCEKEEKRTALKKHGKNLEHGITV